MKYMKSFPSILRTQYAIALLSENDSTKAESYKDEFERIAKTYPHKGDVEADRELMAHALETYHRKKS
ncbi:MAG TPA: hypothetical protein DDZ89_15595 [Clostridiales bacterium]|nr:hypothetical protein [Clostridiales bacterium]